MSQDEYRSILRRAFWLAPQSFAMYEEGRSHAIRFGGPSPCNQAVFVGKDQGAFSSREAEILQIARRLSPSARYSKAQNQEREFEIAKGEFTKRSQKVSWNQ